MARRRLRRMSQRPAPGTPPPTRLDQALDGAEPLARLMDRLHRSQERFAAVADLLPPGLADAVRPGPIDDEGWALLAAHGAAAAKLRQLVPRLEAHLAALGWPALPLKVRIRRPGA